MTLLLAGMFILALGFLRPAGWDVGMPDDVQNAAKMLWHQQFDMVIAGDSRVNQGVVPGVFNRVFGSNLRFSNFGFSSVGYEPRYLDNLEQLLDDKSPHRSLILGITPRSFTPKACSINNFLVYRDISMKRHQLNMLLGYVLHFFRPYNLKEMIFEPNIGIFAIRKPDGWKASWRIPQNDTLASENYSKTFLNNQVSDQSQEILLARVEKWSRAGIHVYGFMPPVSNSIHALEDKFSGFDEAGFIHRFREAGGVWIDMPREQYRTYDGSHMPPMQAVPFTQELARRIQRNSSAVAESKERVQAKASL